MTTTKNSDKGYTIAEAASSLNVPKRTLRHALARPDRKARLLREYRNSKKGLITIEIVPQDLYDELALATGSISSPADAQEPESAQAPEPDALESSEMVQSDSGGQAPARPAETVLIVATYERLLAEKEGRLLDLRTALDAERENSRRLAEALAREQTNHAAAFERLAAPAFPEALPAPKSWLTRLFSR